MGLSIFDILSPAAANPQMAAQIGSPLIAALLKKHGGGGGGDMPAIKPPEAIPAADLKGAPLNLPSTDPMSATFDQGVDSANVLNAAANAGTIAAPHTGMLSRIGDFLKSDEGRAALLRSGAATLQSGNIGSGIMAGANFVDQRRHERESQAAGADERSMRQQQIDNAYNLGLGNLDVNATEAGERSRHNRATEGNDAYRVDSENRRHVTPSGDKVVDVKERRFEHQTPSGDTTAREEGQNFRHGTVSADTAATQEGETKRATMNNQTQITRDRLNNAPTISTHARYQTTPEEYARNGPRLRPSQVQPQDTGAAEVRYDGTGQAFVRGPDGSAVRAPQYDRR